MMPPWFLGVEKSEAASGSGFLLGGSVEEGYGSKRTASAVTVLQRSDVKTPSVHTRSDAEVSAGRDKWALSLSLSDTGVGVEYAYDSPVQGNATQRMQVSRMVVAPAKLSMRTYEHTARCGEGQRKQRRRHHHGIRRIRPWPWTWKRSKHAGPACVRESKCPSVHEKAAF